MFRPILSDYELQNLERKWKSLKKKQEKHPIGNFPKLDAEVTRLYWEIEEAKAIRNNTYKRVKAEKTVYTFIKSLPDKLLFEYLSEIGMNVLRLIDAVEENPDFIKETYNKGPSMKWLPIIRIEDDIVFVKTIRGIEPVRKTSDFCNGACVGDYALCKSIENHLFMYDYNNSEVKA